MKKNSWEGSTDVIPLAAERVRENVQEGGVLAECFGATAVLVPMPRSAPLMTGALWPAAVICEALVRERVADTIAPCLHRHVAVQKSAVAAPGTRPNPEDHYDSLRVDPPALLTPAARIVLVDDVVTRGSTFLGAWTQLTAAFQPTPVYCFALLRAISDGEIDGMLAPVAGMITYRGGRLHREP